MYEIRFAFHGTRFSGWLILAIALIAQLPQSAARADDIDRAVEAQERGDLQGAIELVTRAIESGSLKQSRLVSALETRCSYYWRAMRFDDAFADCNRGLELEPDFGPLLINRAILYIEIGKLTLAQADLRKALEDSRLNSLGRTLAYFHRGRTWQYQNNLTRALADFDTALEIRPSHYYSLVERGEVLLGLGKYYRAIVDYDNAISSYDDGPGAYYGKARAQIELGLLENALADLDKAEEFGTSTYLVSRERGRAFLFLRRNDEAIAEFTRALDAYPDDRLSRDLRGVASFNLGDFAEAADDFAYRPASYTTDWYYENLDFRVLWLYLARSRMTPPKSAEFELRQVAAWSMNTAGEGTWPEPIFSVIGRKVGEKEVFAAAARNAELAAQQTCDANFYLGQIALIERRKAHGRDLLQKAARTCPPASREYVAALSELDRLGP